MEITPDVRIFKTKVRDQEGLKHKIEIFACVELDPTSNTEFRGFYKIVLSRKNVDTDNKWKAYRSSTTNSKEKIVHRYLWIIQNFYLNDDCGDLP